MSKAANDFAIDNENLKTEVASVTTRKIIDVTPARSTTFMTVSDIPEAYRVDAKPWIERPFFVDRVIFDSSTSRYSLLNSTVQVLPGDVARSNPTLLNAFKIASLGRPDLTLNISMAGTIGHAGCILVAVLPPLHKYPSDGRYFINTALCGPHAFLNANEATSVVLPVPWYCNTDMMTLDMDKTTAGYVPSLDININNGNYGTLVFIVMNPLAVATGSTNSLSIIVEACFKNFDMVVPTPRYLTWSAQAGNLGMLNPVYEQYDKCLEQIEALTEEEENTQQPKSKFGKFVKRARIVMLLASLASLTGTLVNSLRNLDLDLLDCAQAGTMTMEPQAGLLSAIGGAIVPGLIGGVVEGGKKLTGDLLDSLGGMFRKWTGLHNPNISTIKERLIMTKINFPNMVDGEQYFEKLDPHANANRIVKEQLFGTDIDEMDITHITSKDQFLGSFKVSTSDDMGQLLWNRPISPFQGGIDPLPDSLGCANNLEMMHAMHRAWRGGLKLKIQSVMNNKQQVKLKVIKYYNPSIKALTAQPDYLSVVNAPSHLLEFTQGGQSLDVELPFLCRNALCPRAENTDFEGMMHGMYYIYVAQPLVASDGSPTNVEFNVYMCGDADLQFYGYTTSNLGYLSFVQSSLKAAPNVEDGFLPLDKLLVHDTKVLLDEDGVINQRSLQLAVNRKNDLIKRYALPPTFFDDPKNVRVVNGVVTAIKPINARMRKDLKKKEPGTMHMEPQSGALEVMNEPQDQDVDLKAQRTIEPIEFTRLIPTINLRDIFRRMFKTTSIITEAPPFDTKTSVVQLGSFLYEIPNEFNYTPIGLLSRLYYGKTVGFKMRLVYTLTPITSGSLIDMKDINIRLYYQPQNLNMNKDAYTITSAPVNVAPYTSMLTESTVGEIPMTHQIAPVSVTGNSVIFEFVIPDTSFYKFMGSPDKFEPFSSANQPNYLSTSDFGSLVIQVTNLHQELSAGVCREIYVGLTDESRFGFQTIAPPFRVRKSVAYYLGTNDSPVAPLLDKLNSIVYKGGFL